MGLLTFGDGGAVLGEVFDALRVWDHDTMSGDSVANTSSIERTGKVA